MKYVRKDERKNVNEEVSSKKQNNSIHALHGCVCLDSPFREASSSDMEDGKRMDLFSFKVPQIM